MRPVLGALLMAQRTPGQRLLALQEPLLQRWQPRGAPSELTQQQRVASPPGSPKLMDIQPMDSQLAECEPMESQDVAPQDVASMAHMEAQGVGNRAGVGHDLSDQDSAFPARRSGGEEYAAEGGGEGAQGGTTMQEVAGRSGPWEHQRKLVLKRKLELLQGEQMQGKDSGQLHGQGQEEVQIGGTRADGNVFTDAPEEMGQGLIQGQGHGQELGLSGAAGDLYEVAPGSLPEDSVPELGEVRSEGGDEDHQALGRHLEFLNRQRVLLDTERHRLLGLLSQQPPSKSRRVCSQGQGQDQGQREGQAAAPAAPACEPWPSLEPEEGYRHFQWQELR